MNEEFYVCLGLFAVILLGVALCISEVGREAIKEGEDEDG